MKRILVAIAVMLAGLVVWIVVVANQPQCAASVDQWDCAGKSIGQIIARPGAALILGTVVAIPIWTALLIAWTNHQQRRS